MPDGTPRPRVFWFDDHKTPNAADILATHPDVVVHRLDFTATKADNWAIMATCHAYCITSARDEVPDQYKGTQALLQRCPELLVLSASGAGFDPIDVEACTDAGVLVVNQSGANAEAVAEHVVAMMLCSPKTSCRPIAHCAQNVVCHAKFLRAATPRAAPWGLLGLAMWASGWCVFVVRGWICAFLPMILT